MKQILVHASRICSFIFISDQRMPLLETTNKVFSVHQEDHAPDERFFESMSKAHIAANLCRLSDIAVSVSSVHGFCFISLSGCPCLLQLQFHPQLLCGS